MYRSRNIFKSYCTETRGNVTLTQHNFSPLHICIKFLFIPSYLSSGSSSASIRQDLLTLRFFIYPHRVSLTHKMKRFKRRSGWNRLYLKLVKKKCRPLAAREKVGENYLPRRLVAVPRRHPSQLPTHSPCVNVIKFNKIQNYRLSSCKFPPLISIIPRWNKIAGFVWDSERYSR